MTRTSSVEGKQIRLVLDGTELEVRDAVDALFMEFHSYAYNTRMGRATYYGGNKLRVVMTRNIEPEKRYARDYA